MADTTETNLKAQSDVALLFKEIYERLGKRSPKFFRVMAMVNLVIAACAGIPTILTMCDVILPPHWAVVVLRIVTFAGLWGKFQNMMAVSHPTCLPYTEKKNLEEAPVVSITNTRQQ